VDVSPRIAGFSVVADVRPSDLEFPYDFRMSPFEFCSLAPRPSSCLCGKKYFQVAHKMRLNDPNRSATISGHTFRYGGAGFGHSLVPRPSLPTARRCTNPAALPVSSPLAPQASSAIHRLPSPFIAPLCRLRVVRDFAPLRETPSTSPPKPTRSLRPFDSHTCRPTAGKTQQARVTVG
jgi:hypothetical protein